MVAVLCDAVGAVIAQLVVAVLCDAVGAVIAQLVVCLTGCPA